ncbi:MAG: hypothetical protein ACPKPY_04770 [Nitrososphaeraceae archaeon]
MSFLLAKSTLDLGNEGLVSFLLAKSTLDLGNEGLVSFLLAKSTLDLGTEGLVSFLLAQSISRDVIVVLLSGEINGILVEFIVLERLVEDIFARLFTDVVSILVFDSAGFNLFIVSVISTFIPPLKILFSFCSKLKLVD